MFGYTLVKKEEQEKAAKSLIDRANLLAENLSLKEENLVIKAKLKAIEETPNPVIDFDIGDPIPTDRKKRAHYVATVAGLYHDILEPKFKQMISNTRAELDDISNSREYDSAMKGAVYCFKEIMRWGLSMVNEQVALQNQDTDKNIKEE